MTNDILKYGIFNFFRDLKKLKKLILELDENEIELIEYTLENFWFFETYERSFYFFFLKKGQTIFYENELKFPGLLANLEQCRVRKFTDYLFFSQKYKKSHFRIFKIFSCIWEKLGDSCSILFYSHNANIYQIQKQMFFLEQLKTVPKKDLQRSLIGPPGIFNGILIDLWESINVRVVLTDLFYQSFNLPSLRRELANNIFILDKENFETLDALCSFQKELCFVMFLSKLKNF